MEDHSDGVQAQKNQLTYTTDCIRGLRTLSLSASSGRVARESGLPITKPSQSQRREGQEEEAQNEES
ncbi:hypothetical protein FRX31_017371 [Thalictrum thalictroides]|uniref:Uncharacterized protein n=1 Tax=Thalictrum thalictroides TaxID=46969 RepID=A0A7J6WA00_THATH|nr:hypothetical protein FRX31_017371 [Thalictrum thalictroides]